MQLQWYNEPEVWNHDGERLTFQVTPQTDYWRKTHYGFIVDDGPFYFTTRGGEFEASVKITAKYKSRFDQVGLMFRIDESEWVKTGIEFVEGKYNYSTVVTHEYSNWSVVELSEVPDPIWIKVIRRLDALEIFYSLNVTDYKMSNIVHFPAHKPAMVGMMAASPDGDGFEVVFEDFQIQHLPDQQRIDWLKKNS